MSFSCEEVALILQLSENAFDHLLGWGLFLDWLIPAGQTALPRLGEHLHHGGESGWLPHLSAVALLVVLAFSYRARVSQPTEDAETDAKADGPSSHERLEMAISGMKCSHCADSVKRSLAESPGVVQVDVDLEHGQCTVTGTNLNAQQLASVVTGLGYSVDR